MTSLVIRISCTYEGGSSSYNGGSGFFMDEFPVIINDEKTQEAQHEAALLKDYKKWIEQLIKSDKQRVLERKKDPTHSYEELFHNLQVVEEKWTTQDIGLVKSLLHFA